jgi:hypothetical protein
MSAVRSPLLVTDFQKSLFADPAGLDLVDSEWFGLGSVSVRAVLTDAPIFITYLVFATGLASCHESHPQVASPRKNIMGASISHDTDCGFGQLVSPMNEQKLSRVHVILSIVQLALILVSWKISIAPPIITASITAAANNNSGYWFIS